MRFVTSILLSCLLITAFPVSAQEDAGGFLIRVFGGTDIVAPTTPTLISATPIAVDQVDLVWGAATDNFLVSGYVISRNGTALATTTQTSYSDSGLTASTTYTYSMRAFDPSFNYSSSSNILSATTPDNPPPPDEEEGSSSQSTATRVTLDEFRIATGVSTTSFFIKTALPARFEVRWGRTGAYELGYVVNDRYLSSYEARITDLEPGMTYEYQVIGYTTRGKESLLKQGQFTTLGVTALTPPANVTRFTAVRVGTDVQLDWQIPMSDDAHTVKVVRSHLGFPLYPGDGAMVYLGDGTSVTDKDILSLYSPVYYTVFVVDENGLISSGAVAMVYATGAASVPGENQPVEIPGSIRPPNISEGETYASTSPTLPPGTNMPEISEIFITQNGITKSFADQVLKLSSDDSLTISIPKEAVFNTLKSIIVTLTDPTDATKTYSFLLRLNKDQSAYEAVLSPLMVEGFSRCTINIYDYKSAVVGTYVKSIMFTKSESAKQVPIFPDLIIAKGLPVAVVVALSALFMWLFLYYRRRKKAE